MLESLASVSSDWERVLRECSRRVPKFEQLPLFGDPERRVIAQKLRRMLYEPRLPWGDWRIEKHIKLLKHLILVKKYRPDIIYVALAKWKAVRGHYFIRKRPAENSVLYKTLTSCRAEWKKLPETHREELEYVELMLKGMPEPAANFRFHPHFIMVRPNHRRDRMLQIENVYKEKTALVALDAEPYSTPSKLRIWLANNANATWMSGERELQNLQSDLDFYMQQQDVTQLPAIGWHVESKLWFYTDCAVQPAKTLQEAVLLPDDEGVIWTPAGGCIVWQTDADNQEWRQSQSEPTKGNPKMHPEIVGIRIKNEPDPKPEFEIAPVEDNKAISKLFLQISERMRMSYATDEVLLAIGVTVAFFAAPELFSEHGGFPGVQIHGPMGSGKSTLAELLMEFHGFHDMGDGIGLQKSASATGLQISAEQYSNQPVYVNEYREPQVEADKIAVLHAGFNRETPTKWKADGVMRKMRTTFIIAGEQTCSNSATRSRYVHVQCARNEWPTEENQLPWFRRHRKLLFIIGRRLMMLRPEFISAVRKHLAEWFALEEFKTMRVHERSKLVYGIAYAGFAAASQIFESHSAEYLLALRKFALTHTEEQVGHIASDININRVWDDAMAMVSSKECRIEQIFKVKTVSRHEDGTPMDNFPPGRPNQHGWRHYLLYIHPNNFRSSLLEYLAKQRRTLALQLNDIRDQMAKDPSEYWLPGIHRQRFGEGAGTSACWCVIVDKHPKGLHDVPDEELAKVVNNGGITEDDPRKGELWQIINWLERPKDR